MRSLFVTLALFAGLAVACRSGGETPQPVPQPVAQPVAQPVDARAERLAVITKEQSETSNAYFDAMDKALGENENPSSADWERARAQVKAEGKFKEPDEQDYSARVQKLIDEDATDITAFHALAWMLDNQRAPAQHSKTIALLEKHHMQRVEMGSLCSRFAQKDRGMLETLAAKSPHAEVRGQALFAMADGLKRDIQYSERIKSSEDQELAGLKGFLGDEKFAALKTLDVAATERQIEATYERVEKEYADVKLYAGTKRETTLGKNATAALFESRNLCEGKPAPQIEGVDLDNVAFKLSDYRGKVVLLDFWGNW